jgi:hypothetical protein
MFDRFQEDDPVSKKRTTMRTTNQSYSSYLFCFFFVSVRKIIINIFFDGKDGNSALLASKENTKKKKTRGNVTDP